MNRTPVMGFGLAQPTVITTLFRAIMFLLMSIMEFTCPAPATTIPLSETMSGDDNEPKTILNESTKVNNFISGNYGASVNEDMVFRKMKNTSGQQLPHRIIGGIKCCSGRMKSTTTTQGIKGVRGGDREYCRYRLWINSNFGKDDIIKSKRNYSYRCWRFYRIFHYRRNRNEGGPNTAIAIALEAYAVADSAGIIDALIISPRAV